MYIYVCVCFSFFFLIDNSLTDVSPFENVKISLCPIPDQGSFPWKRCRFIREFHHVLSGCRLGIEWRLIISYNISHNINHNCNSISNI